MLTAASLGALIRCCSQTFLRAVEQSKKLGEVVCGKANFDARVIAVGKILDNWPTRKVNPKSPLYWGPSRGIPTEDDSEELFSSIVFGADFVPTRAEPRGAQRVCLHGRSV